MVAHPQTANHKKTKKKAEERQQKFMGIHCTEIMPGRIVSHRRYFDFKNQKGNRDRDDGITEKSNTINLELNSAMIHWIHF